MKKFLVFSLVIWLGLFVIAASSGHEKMQDIKHSPVKVKMPEGKTSSAMVKKDPCFGNIPLYFIPNKGQVNEGVRFYARTPRYTLWMTKEGLVFDGIKKSTVKNENGAPERDVSAMVFIDANKNPVMVPVERTQYRVNYLKGNDHSKWYRDVQTSKAVLYKSLYQNIDLKVYGLEKQIEYDWIVKAGGDPGSIRFRYEKVKSTRIDEKGDLVIETLLGELTHQRPVSFQYIDDAGGTRRKVAVNAAFKKTGKNTYGLKVDTYDKSRELIIDPAVLVYSTYLGGSGDDHAFGIVVDGSGCAYVTGDTYSTDFPIDDAYQDTSGGGDYDAFVTKFTAAGDGLDYSTYLGGSGIEIGEGIRVDGSGRAYVTGLTSSTDFPTQNAYQNTAGGDQDAFVSILSSSGSTLDYSTYLGGSGQDKGFAIALDGSNNIYVTGRTGSTNFPTENAFKDTFLGGDYDAFVTKFTASGDSLDYSTYLGGGGKETGYGIAVKGINAYVTGRTTSSDFSIQNEYQDTYGGGGYYDAFVTKFSTSGSSVIYSTYLGGSEADSGYGIAVDSSGYAYVTGDTNSSDFPVQDAFQSTYGGGKDAFVTKFSTTGTTLEYSTYLGGGEMDAAAHVALNSDGNAYVTGSTESSDFPLIRAYQNAYNGDSDGFVSMLTPNGESLSFSTFLGGGDMDTAKSIAVDGSGDIYVAGYTGSVDFPTEAPYQDTLNGDMDTFVSKFSTPQFGTLCGGVDNCELAWTTGGAADWFEQTDTYYYDDDALQSGSMNSAQTSYIQTTVTGPGDLSFWWHVSSDYYYGRLKFYIDGEFQDQIYGTGGDWQQETYAIPEGTHTLKWSYEKDYYWSYGSDCGWLDKVEYTPETSIVLDRTRLTFGVVQGIHISEDQTFSISSSAGGTLNWTAAADQSWLSCSPASGTGGSVVTVSVNPAGLPVGVYTGSITVSASNATNSPQTVLVTLNKYLPGGSSAPFGNYATPIDNSTIRSSVPFTGWVLDDLGVQSVKLYRQNGSSLTFIGDAVFVEGARPDVENAYPGYPDNYKAGWGYMMLTNFLPNGGNGPFTIVAIATDIEGHQVTLGAKSVTVDNANAVKPFGAIDAPAQGGTASGFNFVNWGWALTPQPNVIPTDGSTIDVWVDGVKLGNPVYNIYRSDIANLFPGYANSDGAVGYFYLDTTAYDNGVHTIQWTVEDNVGNTDGIGSRYFMIRNSSPDNALNRGRATHNAGLLIWDKELVPNDPGAVGIVKGYPKDPDPAELEMIEPNEQGFITAEIKELDRIEFRFNPQGQLYGGMVVGNRLKTLPPGSYLDPVKGIFCWQTGAGFVGRYHLVFIEKDRYGNMTQKNVFVDIIPLY